MLTKRTATSHLTPWNTNKPKTLGAGKLSTGLGQTKIYSISQCAST